MLAHDRHMIKLAGGGLAAAFLAGGLYLTGGSLYIQTKAVLAQVLLEKAWAETVETGEVHKAWPWADTWPVALIEAPRLKKRAVVLAGSSGEAMAFGPGHVNLTPEPGDPGVSVLSGHRDTHFRFLKDLAQGDDVFVTDREGIRHHFVVDGSQVVRWDRSGIDPDTNTKSLALVTCYPFNAVKRGPLRYVVYAHIEADLAAKAD